MANPVLSAALSGQRKILLSWTYPSNADFQVYWKSSSPPGQAYVLLATTNAFSYTTADLDPSKTYYFYVRANTGNTFFYSNVVELFVSCGKGVVISDTPPDSPPAQIPKSNIYAVAGAGYVTSNVYVQASGSGNFDSIGADIREWGFYCLSYKWRCLRIHVLQQCNI